MSTTRHFAREGEELLSVPYEYTESGLQGIFLHNGCKTVTIDGEVYYSVIDTEGLHRCIGEHIVFNRKALDGPEIRFLRKTMNMTQSELGNRIGQDSQQIARWEKEKSQIPGPANRLLRIIFVLEVLKHSEPDLSGLLKSIEELDESPPQRLDFCFDHEWKDAA
jgi:DNA-binding transcriptional regulator YiaG